VFMCLCAGPFLPPKESTTTEAGMDASDRMWSKREKKNTYFFYHIDFISIFVYIMIFLIFLHIHTHTCTAHPFGGGAIMINESYGSFLQN
jgi:hypothetical protein